MTNLHKSDALYVVGDSAHERKRLQEQGNYLYPFTRRLFENAGITKGMRVLDVGSGAGDVAFLLAELVGPDGAVVGVDSNPAILETARQRAAVNGYANVSFVAGDIREVDIAGEFDAAAGRLVLLYLQSPTAAIQRVCNFLRPGGVVAFLEPNLTTGFESHPPSPLVDKTAYWLRETFNRARIDLQMGIKLRETLVGAGLAEPEMQIDAVIGGGHSWYAYKYAEDTIRSMLPAMEKLGVATAAEVEIDTLAERLRQEMVSLNSAALLSVWVGAWSRKI